MKRRNSVFMPFFGFAVFLITVACLCSGLADGTPTEAPTVDQPVQQLPTTDNSATEKPAPTAEEPGPTSESSDGLKTFTDQNNYFRIEVPADWDYTQTVDSEKNFYYIDTFTSPDKNALVESVVYDDGEPFTGGQKARFALKLLNTFYSKTGKEGDIRVSDDKLMPDGSERLIWTSRGGGYSGNTFIETRDTTFLLFTIQWVNEFEDTYFDILSAVLTSYETP